MTHVRDNWLDSREQTILVCPHCGKEIPNVRLSKFQTYEVKVATWLSGEVAPLGQAGFDVWNCRDLPGLTFQIKYSKLGEAKRNRGCLYRYWTWHQTNMHPDQEVPHYFILCGIEDDGSENWFVLSRSEYFRHSSNAGKCDRFLQCRPNRYSRRTFHNTLNGIWKYHCPDPLHMTEFVLSRLGESEQPSLL